MSKTSTHPSTFNFKYVLLKMKSPHTINYMYGFKKQYDYIAIKCDAPDQLLAAIQSN